MKRAVPGLILVVGAAVAAGVFFLRANPEPARRPVPRPDTKPEEKKEERREKKPETREDPPRNDAPKRSPFDGVLEALRSGDKEKVKLALDALLKELTPDPVPDAENAALLYREAFAKFVDGTTEEHAAYDAFVKGETLTLDQRAALKSYLEKNKDALSLLRLAADRPRCNFNLDYSKGFALELPHIAKLIKGARLLKADALFAEGDAIGESARVTHRLAEALADEPLLISQLVRTVNHGIASDVLKQALDGSLTDPALRTLLGTLSPEKIRAGFEKSMLGELYMGVQYALYGDDETPRPLDDPLTPHDMTHYAETLEEYTKLIGRPYYEIKESIELLERTRVDAAPWYAKVTKMLMPALGRAAEHQARTEATLGTARLAVALHLYRSAHGAYPASLDALGSPAPDPFTGNPYVYRREGAGFVVYSVGADGRDDGGVSKETDVVFRSSK